MKKGDHPALTALAALTLAAWWLPLEVTPVIGLLWLTYGMRRKR